MTEANALMQPIHARMPVILSPDSYATWLNPAITDPALLQPLLTPYPAQHMKKYPVRTFVNNPRNDGRDLIEPA